MPALLRRRADAVLWAGLVAWTALWAVLRARPSGISWHFFATGAHLLTSPSDDGGVHLYAAHPELQIGPVTFAAAAAITAVAGTAALVAAQVLMTAVLPVGLAVLAPLVRGPRRRLRLAAAGLVAAPAWTVLSVRWAHLDDALALLALCVVVRAAREDRWLLAGVAAGLAAGAKPWAVLALPLLLLCGRRAAALGAAAATAALAWAPFLLGDPGTAAALHPPVVVNGASVLGLLGADGTVPAWTRTAQLVLAPAAAWLAVRRGAWHAALLAGVAARLALDPQEIGYYAAGAVLAAVVADLLGGPVGSRRPGRWPVPWLTLATAVLWWEPFVADFDHRFETSSGPALWWYTHPSVVAALHLGWAVVVLAAVAARALHPSGDRSHDVSPREDPRRPEGCERSQGGARAGQDGPGRRGGAAPGARPSAHAPGLLRRGDGLAPAPADRRVVPRGQRPPPRLGGRPGLGHR